MLITMLYPPQWTPLMPYFAFSSLAGQLRENGYEVEIRDLNIEFYNNILTKDHLEKCKETFLKEFDEVFESIKKEFIPDKTEEYYSVDFKKKLHKYTKIKEFINNSDFENIAPLIDDAVAIMKCKSRFYSPELLVKAMNIIDKGLEMASLPFCPSRMSLNDYNNPFCKLTYNSIKEHCLDKSTNMFYEFYEKSIPGILASNPDMITISINASSQIVPGLTLAMMLKSQTKAHINIGGNYFGRVTEILMQYPEFFELFTDSLNIGEGERPIVEIAKHVEGKLSIDQVPNLLYLENGEVKKNPDCVPVSLNEMYNQDLAGFPLELYFSPDLVMPTQSSRGCYWKMCSFCDHDFGQNLNIKNVDKLVSQMKALNEKFGIKYFEFIDESVSPKYLQELSEKIIESGLDVNWFNNARLENEFTPELLSLASQAGLRMLLWGFESGSDRIMKLINKGIEIDKRIDIMRGAIEAEIWNFAFIFFGFPTETWEDGLKTVEIICNNTDVIASYGRSVFTLGKHTRLRDNPEKFCITEIMENEDELSPSYHFKTSEGMDNKKIMEMSRLCTEKCNEAYNGPLWMYLRYREILFLYICKFGIKNVQEFKLNL